MGKKEKRKKKTLTFKNLNHSNISFIHSFTTPTKLRAN